MIVLITIRLDPTEPAHEQWNKIRQRTHWGTRRWHSLYSNGRNLSESGFAGPRGNHTEQAAPLATRVS